MDIRTGLALFNSLWLIEPQSALALFALWEQGKLKAKSDEEREAMDPQKKFFANAGIIYAPTDAYSDEADNFKGFDGAELAVIPLIGPLMQSDYCGTYGTASLMAFFNLALDTPSVKGIALLADTPGGAVNGTQIFADRVKAANKPTKTIVRNMLGSAGYWIGSASDTVIATSNTDVIGSIGTMVQWYDRSKYMEQNGIVLREYYATQSKDKNKAFRDANKGDGKLLVQTMLDPVNEEFLSAVAANRPGVDDKAKTGHTYISKPAKAVGLIDDIMPIADAYAQLLDEAKKKQPKQQTKNLDMNFATMFPKIAAFLGFKADIENKDVKLEEHSAKIEAALAERDTLKTDNDGLKAKIVLLEKTAGESKTAMDAQAQEIIKLKADLAEEKKKPAASTTAPAKDKDDQEVKTKEQLDASSMDFQQELFKKL